jgi:hypothetical protein
MIQSVRKAVAMEAMLAALASVRIVRERPHVYIRMPGTLKAGEVPAQFSQVPSLVKASRTRLPGTVLDGAVGRSWGRRRPS